MYRSVVVPLDRTAEAEVAIPYGATVARQAAAELEFLTVTTPYMDITEARDQLAGAAERHGVDAKLTVTRLKVTDSGNVTGSILDLAGTADTLICLRTHARRTLTEIALGSVSEHVVRACHHPVLLVGPRCGPAPEQFAAMVVGLDGSELAEQILPVVVDWSSQLAVTPWLFQVLPTRMPLEVGGQDFYESGYVHRIADRLARHDVKAEWDTTHERNPAVAIVRFAEARQPALVALTTHGRSGFGRLALGSVALEVAHRATVPVLVFKPRDTR